MRTSIVPSCGAAVSAPHIVVIGNHKGGSGKSTFAMHIIIALLKAGKRVASFDLDSNQLTLTRYIGNRREWGREHKLKLELPDHCPVTDEPLYGIDWNNAADLTQFMAQLKNIGRDRKHDFIVIDTPSGAQHLSLIAHGMADTLITPINDSLIDLDVLVAIERSNSEPQPSRYAKAVRRALEARRKVCGRATDWIVVRNRRELVRSRNQRQITQVLDVIRERLGFRTAPGLLERPIYREFFAAGLTAFDPVEGLKSGAKPSPSTLLARLEVQDLIREVGLIEERAEVEAAFGGALREIELAMAEANAAETGADKRPFKPRTRSSQQRSR
jgi:chromosome partitioning protein